VPQSLKRKLLSGGFWVVLGKVFTATSRLAATGLLARLLTQEEMGAFGLAFSLVAAGAMVSHLGLQQAVVRLVAESVGKGRPARARAAIGVAFRYCGLGNLGVAAFLVLGGGAWLAAAVWDSPLLAASMVGVAVWIALWSFQLLASETFRGFQDLRSATIFGGMITWPLVLALLGLVRLVEGQASFGQVILVFIGCTATSLLLGVILLRRKVRSLPRGSSLGSGEVLSISLPLWINAITALALGQIDLWILGAFVTKQQVAVYFAAMQLVSLVFMSLLLVNLVVPPFIAELYARGEKQRLQRVLRTTATFAGVPASLVLVAYVLFGATLLGLVYGPAFRAGATVLAVLSVGRLVNVFTGSCGMTLIMTGHQKPLMCITLVTSALTVGSCLLAVRPYGMIGVASAVTGGTILQNVAMLLAARRLTGVWTHMALPRLRDFRALIDGVAPGRPGPDPDR
jgi:O-antigen/teichoic acid export membrane protein